MEVKEILTLAKAGFNAQQIAALNMLSQTPHGAQNTGSLSQPKAELHSLYGAQLTGENDVLQNLTQQINGITSMMQMGNIMGSQQPKTETTDDILAQIINPVNNTGGSSTTGGVGK